MMEKADEQDDLLEKENKKIMDKLNEKTSKSKLYELNDPKILIFVGIVASAIVGFC